MSDAAPEGRGHQVLERLKAFSQYAWMPILIVGVISATLAYKNLSLQESGNRPEMIFNRMALSDPYDAGTLLLGMLNVGTRTAYDYRLSIKTVEMGSGKVVALQLVDSSNPIRKQAGISAEPHLDMSKFLGVLVLCVTYRDEATKKFDESEFVSFPTLPRGLTKDKGGSGQYLAASLSPDDLQKLQKMDVCKG